MLQQVILVNEQDEPIGVLEKLKAHEEGVLHRAFSIFIFNGKGELLLQRRALDKYHSGGLWTNTCCSHPQPGEGTIDAAKRRLNEEMGFTTSLEKIFEFTYKAEFSNGLIEHEFDHVFAGKYDGEIKYNRDEVMDCAYKSLAEISSLITEKPGDFSPWFLLAFPRMEAWWRSNHEAIKN